MSGQRPINILEIKANYHKANTEANASFETIFADMANRIRNLDDQVKVYQTEIEGLKAEIGRLRKKIPPEPVVKESTTKPKEK